MHALYLAFFTVWNIFAVAKGTPTIKQPRNGATIAPGRNFDFEYQSISDYSVSSYHVHVWLLTRAPSALSQMQNFARGHYFGRYEVENFPAVPSPKNPLPRNFTMPDFSKNPGGWGSGQHASDATFYLVVMEEWATGDPSLGSRISLVYNTVRYNATRAHPRAT